MTTKFVFNPLSGQFDLVTASISPSDITGGNPNTFSGFDSTGTLESVPGFAISTVSGGMSETVVYQPNNLTRYTKLNDTNLNVDPLQNSPNETVETQDISLNLDVNNTGFDIGTSGQAATLLGLNLNHNGSSNVGNLSSIVNNLSIGNGTDPLTMKGLGYVSGFGTINANVTIDGPLQGYGFQPNINAAAIGTSNFNVNSFYDYTNIGAPVNNYTTLSSSPTLASIANGNSYTGVNIFPNITTFTGSAGYFGVNVGGTLGSVGSSGFTGVQVNPNITTMAGSAGFSGINIGGTVTTLGTNGYNGVRVAPTITTAGANAATGLSIFMGGVSGTNIRAIDAQEGQVSISNNNLKAGQPGLQVGSTIDTSTAGAITGVFGNNQLGGQLTIKAGSPLVGPFGFGNNLGITIDAEDNFGPDTSGFGLGYSMNGFVTTFGVAAGKTFDTLNFMAAGASNGGTGADTGTFTNVNMFRAMGLVPGGGAAVITNLTGFKVDSFFSALNPTNVWGLSVEDTNAENFIAKSLAIGTVTKKVTAVGTGLEVKTKDLVLDGGDQYITAFSSPGIVTNDSAGKLISVASSSLGFANTDLSNLTNPTAINRTLQPNATNTFNLGTSAAYWGQTFTGRVSQTTAQPYIQLGAAGTAALTDASASKAIDWGNRLLVSGATTKLDWSGTDLDINTRKITNVVDPTSAQDVATKAYVDASAAAVMNQIIYTGGSTGNYTPTVGSRWFKIKAVGGGGGGGCSTDGTTFGTGAADGTDTTFGAIVAGKGMGALGGGDTHGGVGGSVTGSGAGIALAGAYGQGSGLGSAGVTVALNGGMGGGTPLGSAGAGGGSVLNVAGAADGVSAANGSGSGGGGGGQYTGGATSFYTGSGGGAAGYVDTVYYAPFTGAPYAYSVGVGGTGEAAVTAGFSNGGNGGDGIIIIEEYF